MEEIRMNSDRKFRINSVEKRDNITYEDDGFFSDVPVSGSLSRSLIALNKYVKKNLLYDEEEESEEDIAYFSKEGSPNDSVVKYDSDSLKSNESSDKEENVMITTNNKAIIPLIQGVNEPEIARLHINKVINEPISDTNKSINNLTVNKLGKANVQSLYESESEDNITMNDIKITVIKKNTNNVKNQTSNDISNKISNTATTITYETLTEDTKLTDDYKYMQLLDESRDSTLSISINPMKSNVETLDKNHAKPMFNSTSNLTCVNESEEQLRHSKHIVHHQNSSDIKTDNNRHTIHDFSNWVNRTTVYPDVYAPLPYKSPRRYVESDVNIHYRCPVRHDPLPLVPERELARQQAEHMKRLYREQKRNKYLQELQDMQNRRHQDNFTPSQKTVVPLNRYDEAERVIARALYAFNGQTPRELSFRKGDLINVRRQIDNNWYEGEIHGRIGLFPYNYVEIQKSDVIQPPKKPAMVEGRARAKFDFTAQTNLELPLKKGEVVVLTRRIDQNWWEGKNSVKTGIFPDSYITVLQEPSQNKPEPLTMLREDKPVASPAAHGLLNGSAKRSMGSHSYTPQPNSPALSNAPPATQPLPGYVAKPAQATLTPSERGYGPPAGQGVDLNNTEPLYVDTNAEAIPYRAMYKYRPQNPDELELNEGDTVYVLEKCDDGWYVGSSQRTGRFGTFPGNYVERI